VIAFDYMFLDGKSPTLVYRDRNSRRCFAHLVSHKGIGDPWILNQIIEDLDSLGYRRIVLKSDQEPAIRDLPREVRLQRRDELVALMKVVKEGRATTTGVDLSDGETVLENSPAGTSRSNGFIERSSRSWKDKCE
jgi:hypothetical protein